VGEEGRLDVTCHGNRSTSLLSLYDMMHSS